MLVFRRSAAARLVISLVALALALTGCVGEWSPEEAAARTATAAAYLVPTKASDLSTEAPPTPTSEPQPTEASSPTPVSVQPQASPATDLAVGVQAGQLSPDFVLNDTTGQVIALNSLRGQPVAVIFWASWCPHCQNEMPLMQDMYDKYADQGLAVIGVNVPGLGGDTKDQALAFIDKHDITFPVVFDEGGSVYQQYQVQGVPNLFFIDRNGVVVANYPGAMDAQRLEDQVLQLLEEG